MAAGPFKGRAEITMERRMRRENRTIRQIEAEKKAIRARIDKYQIHARSLAEQDARELAYKNWHNQKQWQQLEAQLNPEEKRAYAIGRVFSDQTELEKMAGKVLTPQTAPGFEQRHGTKHLARQLNEREAAVKAIDEEIAAKTSPASPRCRSWNSATRSSRRRRRASRGAG